MTKSEAYRALRTLLSRLFPHPQAELSLREALRRCSRSPEALDWDDLDEVVELLAGQINRAFGSGPANQFCTELARAAGRGSLGRAGDDVGYPLRSHDDLVRARRSARQLALRLGASGKTAMGIATAVSELGRLILTHCGSGEIRIYPLDSPQAGIALSAVVDAEARAQGRRLPSFSWEAELAILMARRLMDELSIETPPEGEIALTAVKYFEGEKVSAG